MIYKIGLTLTVALLAGAIFSFIHFPLPWMLGPLAGMIIWSAGLGGKPVWPIWIRNCGLIILGYLICRPFTPEAASRVIAQYPEMLAITISTVLFSLLLSYITYKQTGISLATGIIGGVPGGLSQMAVSGEEIPAADGTIVTFMQTMRILAVVFAVPFLALHVIPQTSPAVGFSQVETAIGFEYKFLIYYVIAILAGTVIAVKLNLPTPFLIGPVLSTCILTVQGLPAPALPKPLIITAQLLVGTYFGAGVKLHKLQEGWRKILPYTLFNVIAIILFSFFLGWLLTLLIPVTLTTGFLSAAPGGIAEMGLAAIMVNADLSTVVSFQLFRVFFILLVLPLFLKFWLRDNEEGKR